MEQLDVSLITEIISYIGPKWYRFVAPIDRRFHTAYTIVFQNDTRTHVTAMTAQHAQICYEEYIRCCDDEHMKQKLEIGICCSAAKCGNLPALQYLRSVHCQWDEYTCLYAAWYGHLPVLQWAKEQGCVWDAVRSITNTKARGNALDLAIQRRHKDVARYLIETCPNYCNTEIKDMNGRMQLYLAICYYPMKNDSTYWKQRRGFNKEDVHLTPKRS
jgi:hypothetical protein